MFQVAGGAVLRRMLVSGAAMTALLGAAVMTSGTTGAPSTSSCTAAWPMYQHDAGHSANGCSTVSQLDAPGLHLAWFASTGGAAVTAEPIESGGLLYVGDYNGLFHAVSAATGVGAWTFNIESGANTCGYADQHQPSYGEITSSAAVGTVPSRVGPVVYFGGGGTLYALDATTGTCLWHQDVDPVHVKSPTEIESSPVLDVAANPAELIVGSDSNGATGTTPGLIAFNAGTGALLWKYLPATNQTQHTLSSRQDDNTDSGCGDVWSSPALDTSALSGDGMAVFGVGDCNRPSQFSYPEALIAVDATTGNESWAFHEPPNGYDYDPSTNPPSVYDDDFGASPIITAPLPTSAGTEPLVIEGGKSGFVYGLDESGHLVWQVHAAQSGNYNVGPGGIGGFIGSPALGMANGRPTVFLTSAILSPLAGGGIQGDKSAPTGTFPDTGLVCAPGFPPAPNTTGCDPLRATALHAVDAATGTVVWQAPLTTPTYAPASYTNGVVFAPSTTSFANEAFDADTGTQLWVSPIAAAASSGTSIAGQSIFFGGGTGYGMAGSEDVPPQNFGIWSFTTALAIPSTP
ncbi:MAG TPA: PQQ-binding-like beta-propeller repeat protein [Acidimicrobiales bacterium]|nr:PQQ-binding-like beta-propeller repeat protein [Acidimicrobiales bacterium]